jgi:hypothetical protein
MWTSKGRSGYGDSTLQGDYDDWQGLSRNGRQWKSEATHLPFNLQGADYWHLRKQIRPTEEIPKEMHAVNDTVNLNHCLPNGKANLLAYADKAAPTKKSSLSIEDKILPQAARVRRLTEQLIELEQAKKAGMDLGKYSKLRDILIVKRNRAEVLLQKALSVKLDTTDEDTQEFSTESYEDNVENDSASDDSCEDYPVWLLNTNPSNCLRNPLIKACKVGKILVRWHQKARNYINELKAL